jgi:hypothetical protein
MTIERPHHVSATGRPMAGTETVEAFAGSSAESEPPTLPFLPALLCGPRY